MTRVATARPAAPRRRRVTSLDVFCLVLLAAVLARFLFGGQLSGPAVSAWATVFAAICVQASPFLVLGVTLSTAIAVLVPPPFFTRVLPSNPLAAVPVAGVAGVLLPGCECGSVPVAASLMRRGVGIGPSVAFLLSAPAINPVVLAATEVAFRGQPLMVLARLVASLVTAVAVGWLWQLLGRQVPVPPRRAFEEQGSLADRLRVTASHDLAQSVGLLVIGAASVATIKAVVPGDWLDRLGTNQVGGVLALAVLAVLLAVCSEADAFIAASLTQFSLTARLVFMVVGPGVDLKLIAMQAGTFGRGFALRFAPLTLLVATVVGAIVGAVLL